MFKDLLHKRSERAHYVELDDKALDVVREKLRLQRPIKICLVTQDEFGSSYGESDDPNFKVLGQYLGFTRNGSHHIHIDDSLSLYLANEALFHEMTHAAQAERVGGYHHFRRMYRDAHDLGCMAAGCGCMSHECQVGYKHNILEDEALATAAKLMFDGRIPRPIVPIDGFKPRQMIRKAWTPR